MTPYLEALTERLTTAMGKLSPETRQPHIEYLVQAQNSDGGYSGREGESDLYYTSFALRSLALLDALDETVANQAASYLRDQLQSQAAVIDFLSLLYSALLLQTSAGVDLFEDVAPTWRESVGGTLESFRREDGGYSRTVESPKSSTYQSFLVVLCQQLIAWEVPEPQRLVTFIQSMQREDGGFVEIPAMKRSGTNPTCAAIALLKIFDALDEDTSEGAIEYLLDRQTSEGGLAANTRIPVADTLSTFTGMLTLADLDELHELELDRVANFLESMRHPQGGFHGAIIDEHRDVEYTFYGLGCLALFQEAS